MSTINPHGKEIISVTADFCGRPLTLEVNRVGFRTTASVLVKYGDTVVLVTACMDPRPKSVDFLPLTCDYRENTYAAGKIPGQLTFAGHDFGAVTTFYLTLDFKPGTYYMQLSDLDAESDARPPESIDIKVT